MVASNAKVGTFASLLFRTALSLKLSGALNLCYAPESPFIRNVFKRFTKFIVLFIEAAGPVALKYSLPAVFLSCH